ncbi:MAG TPA: nucleotidyltransferase domain-containing protein [Thermomicrobiales bacterium]|nr:nucleotidyltransferase domain-containing protein [Thermomicrobiales bacterium]
MTVIGPILLESTGDERADGAIRRVVAAFEAAFPGRVRGYYVEGSHADRTPVAASDLDLAVVFRGAVGEDERSAAAALARECAARDPVELDAGVLGEADLARGATPMFKLAGRCVHGEDIRDRVPLMPLADWTRDRMHASYWLAVHVFGRPVPVAPPFDYPDPAGEFYGYDRREVRLADGAPARSTRDLIRVTGWMATALVALRAGRYVARKRDCHVLYRECIGDEWAPLLAEIYTRCRGEWHCLVPDDPADRRRLRALCARALAFENHFLAQYRPFLLAELRAGDAARRDRARWVVERVPLCDDVIAAAAAGG